MCRCHLWSLPSGWEGMRNLPVSQMPPSRAMPIVSAAFPPLPLELPRTLTRTQLWSMKRNAVKARNGVPKTKNEPPCEGYLSTATIRSHRLILRSSFHPFPTDRFISVVFSCKHATIALPASSSQCSHAN